MPNLHSTWSASGADRWMGCPGSLVLGKDAPRSSSKFSAEGTAYHEVLTWALQEDKPAAAYVGRVVEADGYTFDIDEENCAYVQTTIDYVKALAGDGGVILADIRVCYADYLGTSADDGWGTADVIILRGDELVVLDLKMGRGVEVSAERNKQMSLYALGALAAYNGIEYEFKRVRMAISQPRITGVPSEWDCSVEELEAWGRNEAKTARLLAQRATDDFGKVPDDQWNDVYLRPGEKQCRWCPSKSPDKCAAMRNHVAEQVMQFVPATPDEFADAAIPDVKASGEQWLSACLSKVDLIEDWCKAVRAEVESRLLAGKPIPGFKLVEGKQGNRAWADAATAEATLKSFRLKVEDMYDLKLISPTSAEKLAKAKQGEPLIGPRQWTKLQGLITRAPAKPHVAPESDPRPALDIKPVADEFDSVAPSGAEEFA